MINKPETRSVHNENDLANLVVGDLVDLELGLRKLVPAVHGGLSDTGRRIFIARFPVGHKFVAARYDAVKVNYDGKGALVMEGAESTEYQGLGQVPGSDYTLLNRAGLVRE